MNPDAPISMVKENNGNTNHHTQTWGTWEELLLACAVKRHGFKNWDSVAMEVQTKSALPRLLTTAQNCKLKYQDLKRRFTNPTKEHEDHLVEEDEEETEVENNTLTGDKVDNIPWLEELRKVRVAELRREVQRYDVSILSLQLKVKRLEEERQRSLQDNGSVEHKPDLDKDLKVERSEDDKNEPERSEPGKPTEKKSASGEESDRENRSVNESNSTGSDQKSGAERAGEGEAGQGCEGSGDGDPVLKRAVGEDSCNRSSGVSESEEELGESGTQLSGDVQSSASLGGKRKRKGRRRKEISGGGDEEMKEASVKSEPLVGLMEMIRAHQHSSLFERRHETQESEDYNNLVRQHLDLQTIESKVEQGSYSSCTLSFYRDLLLLFNNAILFFPKTSLESITALLLRNLVSTEMKKDTQEPPTATSPAITHQPKPELQRSDSLLARHKSSAPLIVSRKRSSVATKPSSSSSFAHKADQHTNDDKKPGSDQKLQAGQSLKEKEKPVTGTRSSRRSNNKNSANGSTNTSANNKQTTNSTARAGSADKQETPKTDKKKTEPLPSNKKRSVVDFLKRIKKNSPVDTQKKGSRGGGEQKKNASTGKKEKGKERVLRNNGDKKKVKEESSPSKRTVGRPPKKAQEPASATASGKRGKEGGGKEKQPRKRPRW